MSNETHFSFDEHYPKNKHWRGGPEKLAGFTAELALYQTGLESLLRYLSQSNFTQIITLGFSAANMMHDLNSVNTNRLSLPTWISITGSNKWKLFSQAQGPKFYRTLGISFNNSLILDDYAETAQKAINLHDSIIKPLAIETKFAFLTATKDAAKYMTLIGIHPFIAVENASDSLITLLRLRKSPNMVS